VWCWDPSRAHQCHGGYAALVAFNGSTAAGGDAFSVLDLDGVNAAATVAGWHRGFATVGGKSGMLVVDEFTAADDTSAVMWAMHTHATAAVAPNGTTVVLTASTAGGGGGQPQSVAVHVLEPPSASVTASVVPLFVDNDKNFPDPGLVKVVLTLAPAAVRASTLLVVQIGGGGPLGAAVRPLAAWNVSGPLL
jgi:hypothetical protein